MLTSDQLETLLRGTWVTVQITVYAAVFGTALAVVFGVMSRSQVGALRGVARVYVELFRGVSAVILLFWVFFSVPTFGGPELSPMAAGVLALGLNMGAYGAEIVRGGIAAVPRGQTEASVALNLSAGQRLRSVVLPQAVVVMLPPYGNLLIELLKGTSLVSLITLTDLTNRAQNLRIQRPLLEDPPSTTVIFGTVLVIYFVLAQILAALVRLAERRASRGLEIGRQR